MAEHRFSAELVDAQREYDTAELAINHAHEQPEAADLDGLREVCLARLEALIALREAEGVTTHGAIQRLRAAARA